MRCPNCGSDNAVLLRGNDGAPDQIQCPTCGLPPSVDLNAAACVADTATELLAGLLANPNCIGIVQGGDRMRLIDLAIDLAEKLHVGMVRRLRGGK